MNDRLIELIGKAKIALAVMPPKPDFSDWKKAMTIMDERNRIVRAAITEFVEAEGGRLNLQAGGACGYAMELGGIRTTCTSSLEGLLRNWITAARRRLDKEAARHGA